MVNLDTRIDFDYKTDRYVTDVVEDLEKSSKGSFSLVHKWIGGPNCALVLLYIYDNEYYVLPVKDRHLHLLKEQLMDPPAIWKYDNYMEAFHSFMYYSGCLEKIKK